MLKKVSLYLLIFVLCFSLSACEEDETTVANEAIKIMYSGFEYDGIYTGTLKKGKPNGLGYFASQNMAEDSMDITGAWTYEGEWENGKITGEGVLTFAAGSRYEGEFDTGTLNGYGKYYEKDTLVYEGEWRYDMPHGQGTLYNSKSGKFVYEGEFIKGMPADESVLE